LLGGVEGESFFVEGLRDCGADVASFGGGGVGGEVEFDFESESWTVGVAGVPVEGAAAGCVGDVGGVECAGVGDGGVESVGVVVVGRFGVGVPGAGGFLQGSGVAGPVVFGCLCGACLCGS
jgi:hypothetical protein